MASIFFRDLLEQPNPSGPFVPIPTCILAKDLWLFLGVVKDQGDCYELSEYTHDGTKVQVPAIIHGLSVEDTLKLVELADRFDCEAIGVSAKMSLEIFYATLDSYELLEVASSINSIELAKRAIIKMPNDMPITRLNWWKNIRKLRPKWQIDLTRLIWVFQRDFVNRPPGMFRTLSEGRRQSRTREAMMVQTIKSYEDVAAAFNPDSEVSVEQAFS